MLRHALALMKDRYRRLRGGLVNELRFRMRHPDASISDGVLLQGADRITAGRRLFLDRRCYLNPGNLNANGGFIRMGDNVEIGPYAVIWGAGGVTIGDNVHIGAHVSITAHEARHVDPARSEVFGPLEFDFAPVVIESHVLICSGAQIIPGVRIGHHAMIGGGAVVTADIPPYALAVGCPARVIKYSNIAAATGDVVAI